MTSLHPAKSKADVVISVATAGDMAVGKSALIRCFCHGVLDRHDYQSTTGVDIECKEFNIERPRELVARLQLFDTAGQERFRAITPTFFRKRDGYIFVYDVTDISTLESIAEEWVPQILRHGTEGAQVIILGNKVDLVEGPRSTTEEESKLIHTCSQRLAENGSDVEHHYTSAVTGEGVEEAFRSLSERIAVDRFREDAALQPGVPEEKEGSALWGMLDSLSTTVGLKKPEDQDIVDLKQRRRESSSMNESRCCSG
eukprot:gb/GECG01006687.1/.p1 GENE.gb/GECG01006687.1/~~gb/GECG01006687.1/.p1  ORF type:complete len:256 (+),score=33.07 gb/GECG01006687.1/:1-768(+)